jgi:hypothetical protein
MNRHLSVALSFIAIIAAFHPASLHAEEWTEPKDGLLTETQVVNYAAAQKEITQLMKAMGKAMEGSKSGVGALALAAGMDDKINAILSKHDLKRLEYEWANGKLFEGWGAAISMDIVDQTNADLVDQKKKNLTDVAAAQQKVMEYEKAIKANTRVMTKQQRESAIQIAKDAQTSATDEAKQHAEDAKTAADEAAKIEADAKTADGLAKNPPADVDKDSREDYVKGKKEEAENLRASAKEARDREKDARKLEAESKIKAAAAIKAIDHPEIPVTEEEKTQAKAENTEGLANAKSEIDLLRQAGQLLQESDGQMKKQQAEALKDMKPQNVALVRKHRKLLEEAWGMNDKK